MMPYQAPRSLRLALCCLLMLAALAPSPVRAETLRPNVIFIVIDATRADHLSYAGYARETTPNLDSLAQDSTIFLNAESPSSWTLPSYTSLLSGKASYKFENKPGGCISTLKGTVAENFNEAGYDTVSIQTNFFLRYLDSEFSEHYWYMSPYNNIANKDADGKAVDEAIAWLDQNQSSSYFMFMGLIGPHSTYYPHSEFFNQFFNDKLFQDSPLISVSGKMESQALLKKSDFDSAAKAPDPVLAYYDDARIYQAAYDSEIAYTDEQLGRLLQYLKDSGQYDSSLIVVTADHGENMAEGSNYFTHGDNLRQSETNVPLLVKLPYQNTGNVVTDYVSTLDAFPTIYQYLGWPNTNEDGDSLLPLIYGEDTRLDQGVVSYVVSPTGVQYSYIENGLKLIKYIQPDGSNRYELYDLRADPHETMDLSAQYSQQVGEMDARLTAQVSAD